MASYALSKEKDVIKFRNEHLPIHGQTFYIGFEQGEAVNWIRIILRSHIPATQEWSDNALEDVGWTLIGKVSDMLAYPSRHNNAVGVELPTGDGTLLIVMGNWEYSSFYASREVRYYIHLVNENEAHITKNSQKKTPHEDTLGALKEVVKPTTVKERAFKDYTLKAA